MAGGRVHFGTFDAERSWRPPDLAELPGAALRDPGAARSVDTMDELLAAFCSPGDLLVTRHPIADGIRDGLAALGIGFEHHRTGDADGETVERRLAAAPDTPRLFAGYDTLEPWAVRHDTELLTDRLGRGGELPRTAAVAEVNSKTWSNALVRELGLPGAGRIVRSTEELASAVAELDHEVVVKDPFGVSGKGTLEVTSPRVLAAVIRTLDRQADRGRRVELLVQRRFDGRRDFSANLHVARDGTWEWTGVQVMTNRGYRNHVVGPAPDDFTAFLRRGGYPDALAAVAGALTRAGYWGPAGVDSMLLTDGTVIPILEINARRSLGLVALTLDARAAEHGLRCHLSQADLKVPPGRGVADIVDGLRRAGALYECGRRPGALILGGSALASPGGRVHCALFCPPDEVAATHGRVLAAAEAAGMTPRGGGADAA
ncbi:hypothetical protein [Marinactinospora rubrisoli]|uniref:ATP-grasp domain-containing protein n=1 Tax=Marinactinospora rubrisoli TaxID=2715399 RepID=A0ABW2KKN3_9ACTN